MPAPTPPGSSFLLKWKQGTTKTDGCCGIFLGRLKTWDQKLPKSLGWITRPCLELERYSQSPCLIVPEMPAEKNPSTSATYYRRLPSTISSLLQSMDLSLLFLQSLCFPSLCLSHGSKPSLLSFSILEADLSSIKRTFPRTTEQTFNRICLPLVCGQF